MTTASEFADFLADVCPTGAVVEPCTEDGERLRAPGSFSRYMAAALTAPAELDALVRVRFGPPAGIPAEPGTFLSIYTTDPWTQLPDGNVWVAPDLAPTGELLGWLRVIPFNPDDLIYALETP